MQAHLVKTRSALASKNVQPSVPATAKTTRTAYIGSSGRMHKDVKTNALFSQQAGLSRKQPFAMSTRSLRLGVVCMAHPRRVAKVASQIQRELSNMLVTDQVVVKAITPERASGLMELSAVASVTHVYVSNDLQVVKAYVSIYSDERGKQRAMNNLKKLEGYVRREMGQRVPLRLTPEYRFEYDDSIEEADLIERVIGAEDVARYRSEFEAETSTGAAATASKPQASATAGNADDDEGFFSAVADSSTQGASSTTGSKADSEGFFDDAQIADEEPEEDEDEQYETFRSTDVFMYKGPFDNLFESQEDAKPKNRRRQSYRGGKAKKPSQPVS